MAGDRLRVAVSGLAITYPLGGVFWDYVQYLLGLRRLGHDVLYIEDTGRWSYDAGAQTFREDGASNAASFARWLRTLDPDLVDRWFYRDAAGERYGRSWPEVVKFCRQADLFIDVSASCWMREEYCAAARTAFVDTDPVYTQASVPGYLAGSLDGESLHRVETLRRHGTAFTFAENIGAPDCSVPAGLFDWIPTRQPIVVERFARRAVPPRSRRPVLTTVGSWRSDATERLIDGTALGGKDVELERFISMPAQSVLPLQLATGGGVSTQRLATHGWRMVEGYAVSSDPWIYRDYLARSAGEWSVAKNAYVHSHSGWFSGRTACYLALAVPAVVQDTGFSAFLPTGEGLFAFDTIDEASAAIEQIAADPARHARAAAAIAHDCFESGKVLGRLLEAALA